MPKIGKSVGLRSRRSISFQAVKDCCIMKWLLIRIGKKLRNKLIRTVSSSNSIFKANNIKSLYSFNWTVISGDFKKTNPMLATLLEACIDSNRCAVRCPDKNVIISVMAGILLRNCSQRANLLQTMFSLVLYACHSPKKVSYHFLYGREYKFILLTVVVQSSTKGMFMLISQKHS